MRRTRHANPAPKLTLTASPTASPKIRSDRRRSRSHRGRSPITGPRYVRFSGTSHSASEIRICVHSPAAASRMTGAGQRRTFASAVNTDAGVRWAREPVVVRPVRRWLTVGSPVASHPAGQRAKPLLGLRRKPGRLALAIFRIPLPLYRRGWGWLLGHTFLLLVHAGRKTGKPHSATAMVLRYDPQTHEAVIFSAWGQDTDWVRNIRVRPGAAGPDRTGVVHTAAALPVRGRERRRSGRVPPPAPVEVAPRHMDHGLGGPPFGCCRAGIRPHQAVRLFASGGSLPSPTRPCRWPMRIAHCALAPRGLVTGLKRT